MRLVAAHTRAITLGLVREPAFVVITVVFPALLLAFLSDSRVSGEPTIQMGSFAVFAFLGIALFELGAETAKERESPWEAYVRVLPVHAGVRFVSRLLSALLLASLGSMLVVAVSLLLDDVDVALSDWVRFGVALVLGSVPLALLGIWLGYTASSGKSATSIANLLYVLLAFGGGLWIRADELPPVISDVSPYMPTRPWAELTWQALEGRTWDPADWLALAGFAVAFGLLAARAYARDEGHRYG